MIFTVLRCPGLTTGDCTEHYSLLSDLIPSSVKNYVTFFTEDKNIIAVPNLSISIVRKLGTSENRLT